MREKKRSTVMTELFFALVSDWGAPALAFATFLSCLAVPVPTSMMMLAAGAFVASGDLQLAPVVTAAFFGAIAGDQAGFGIGRTASTALIGWLRVNRSRAKFLEQAQGTLDRRGAPAVFLSRWLFSPLGPYVNLLTGAAQMPWLIFTIMSALGEAIWVTIYVGLGFIFYDNLGAVAAVLADSAGFMTSALIALLTGYALFRRKRVY